MTDILGRTEQVNLPEFALSLPAKVDTGAYSSSIDCESWEIVEREGRQVLEFVLLRPGRPGYTGKTWSTASFETSEIKNANGIQQRFVLLTELVVGGKHIRGRLSLANRAKLRYPLLLGRQVISKGRFLVDVTKGQGLPGEEEERNP